MNLEDNNDLEIVMGEDSNIEISEVGDIMNDLKPNTTREKKPIIIPVSMNKSQNTDTKNYKEENNNEESTDENSKDSTLEEENDKEQE